MIRIEIANEANADVLALLGRITYSESHGHFIDDKNDLKKYTDDAFSVYKTKQDLSNPKHLFYLVYYDDLPVGYAKLIVNFAYQDLESKNSCRLERIYILNDFLPLKIGHQLLRFVEEQAKQLLMETMWLSVYTENKRAIRFYERNEYINIGDLNFLVNSKEYKTLVFSKKLRR